jgi:isopenicillin-N N-acyltransferase-like protein
VLDSTSREAAETALREIGVASACHITIADATGANGFECTALDIVEIPMNANGMCFHSNHLVKEHKVSDTLFLHDSPLRLARIQELVKDIENPTIQNLSDMLKDEQNFPTAINRAIGEKSTGQTLFSIVMDLKAKVARVKMGRPTEDGDTFELTP